MSQPACPEAPFRGGSPSPTSLSPPAATGAWPWPEEQGKGRPEAARASEGAYEAAGPPSARGPLTGLW